MAQSNYWRINQSKVYKNDHGEHLQNLGLVMDTCEILLVALLVIFTVVPLGVIMFIVDIVCRIRVKRQRNRVISRRMINHVGLSML